MMSFIKIGSKLIPIHHIREISNPMADDVKREVVIITDKKRYSILEYSPDYPEALAAYEFLCKDAHRFDDDMTTTDRGKESTMPIADAIRALAHSKHSVPSHKDLAEARTEVERYTANHEFAFEPHHCKDCNALSGDYTTDDGIFCSTCYDKRYGDTTYGNNNTIIVLNPTEEKLLRQIAFIPLAANCHEDLEQAVKGLNEYGFIYLGNHNRNWFITKAGERWIAEHAETSSAANTEAGYTVEYNARSGFYNVLSKRREVLFIGTQQSADNVADLLLGQTAALRKEVAYWQRAFDRRTEQAKQEQTATLQREVDTMQDRIDDLDHMVNEARRERDAARGLYNGKHERIEELKGELVSAQKRIAELTKQLDGASTQITNATYYLGQSKDSDENSNRAYNILQGYTQAE